MGEVTAPEHDSRARSRHTGSTYRQYAIDPEVLRAPPAPPVRPSTTAVLAAVAAGLVAATTTAVVPAHATLAIPVDCSSGPVTLAWDDVTYDLDGNCGLVRVTADDATVSMPTAVRLVVAGRGNTIVAKPVDELVVRGRGHDVRPVSVQRLRLASPRSVVDVDGLVESARLGRSGATAARRPGQHAPGRGFRPHGPRGQGLPGRARRRRHGRVLPPARGGRRDR